MTLLRALVAVLLILWVLGLALHLAGSLIHMFVVVALVLFVVDLGRRRGTA